MKFPFDLSNFKKTAHDKESTTLQHKDGHSIKIIHKQLSPKFRTKLHELPLHKDESKKVELMSEGGKVSDDEIIAKKEKTDRYNKEAIEHGVDPAPYDEDVEHRMSETEVKHYADGGKVDKSPTIDKKKAAEVEKGATESGWQPETWKKNLKEGLGLADGGEVPDASKAVTININSGGAAPGSQLPPVPASMQAQAPSDAIRAPAFDPGSLPYGTSAVATPQPAPAMPTQQELPQQPMESAPKEQPDVFGTTATMDAYNAGLTDQAAGIKASEQAQAQEAKIQQIQLQSAVAKEQQQAKVYQDHYNQLDAERKGFINDINGGHIDPNHYLSTMGTGTKVANAIGLILGGIAGGGEKNVAVDFLNKQIDRDIQGQLADLGKKENLLSINMRQFGNIKDATDMTRVMSSDMLKNQLQLAAAKTTDPLAKARALQAIGQLESQAAPILGQLASRKTIMSMGSQGNGKIDPSFVIKSIVPPNEQEHYFKELGEANAMTKAKDNVLASFDKLQNINTLANRTLSPLQSKRQVDAIKGPLLAALSKETAGRFTEQDAALLDGLFPAAGDSQETLQTKRAQINKLISEKMNFPRLKSLMIDPTSSGRFGGSGQSNIRESAPVKR